MAAAGSRSPSGGLPVNISTTVQPTLLYRKERNHENEVRVLSVSGQFATQKNSPAQNSHCTTESQIATMTISICVACRMKGTLNES